MGGTSCFGWLVQRHNFETTGTSSSLKRLGPLYGRRRDAITGLSRNAITTIHVLAPVTSTHAHAERPRSTALRAVACEEQLKVAFR
jgi:hypothetical protein